MSTSLSRHERQGLSYLRGGRGTSLVLLHGSPGSSHSWKAAGEHLTSHYDVIIPDLSGFGSSESLDHVDRALYLEAQADAVHRLLTALHVRRFFLAGHDFGGTVALTLLRLFPTQAVEGLVLVATNTFTDPGVPLLLRLARVPVLGRALSALIAGTRPGLRLMYWVGSQNRGSLSAADFARHLTPSSIEQTRRSLHDGLADPHGHYEQIEELLPELDVPTLVLWGNHDPFLPVSQAKRLVRRLPYATLTILDETGHFVPEERAEMTAWHVDDFLRAPLRQTGKTSPEQAPSRLDPSQDGSEP
jgi:pimeloyl-ACP methyl ester carboxylesterase